MLVLDEMQISEGVSFDRDKLSFIGFTDLGDYTPEHQKKARADHALVFMFQPFRGKWVQNIAAFLSKGAASGNTLSHLITECIVLLENHGFQVDVVTSDGASWNYNVWKQFGLDGLNASCCHPCSIETGNDLVANESENDLVAGRRLWFCSDFSHFRDYMLQWRDLTKANDYVFLSNNTSSGFQATLRSVIEVMNFLTDKCGYKFLLTARFNQDALEVNFIRVQ